MQYLRYTYVDAVTGVPVTMAPARNGPASPNVEGLVFDWARETAYPTNTPEFFGFAPDDAAVHVAGVVEVLTAEAFEALKSEELTSRAFKARERAKAAREAAVAAIKVTTASGRTYDGDEVSQGRLARAIIALSTGLASSVTWVLADNTVVQATAAELTEVLVLAGQAQAAIWVIQ